MAIKVEGGREGFNGYDLAISGGTFFVTFLYNTYILNVHR